MNEADLAAHRRTVEQLLAAIRRGQGDVPHPHRSRSPQGSRATRGDHCRIDLDPLLAAAPEPDDDLLPLDETLTRLAAIKKVAPGDRGVKLEITITRVTPDGADWVPFRKAGSCTFATTYVLATETPWSEFTARGGIEGEVTQTMTGLCSTEEYRDKMAEKIAEEIQNNIASKIAKHS